MERARQRRNVTRACDQCKKRKRRCTGTQPCATCLRRHKGCTYDSDYSRGRGNGDVSQAGSGWLRSTADIADSGATSMIPSRAVSPSHIAPGQYVGPASPFLFLRRAFQRYGNGGVADQSDGGASIFAYGDRIIPPINEDVQMYRLPSLERSRALIHHFFEFAAPTYRFYHEPTVLQWLEEAHSGEFRDSARQAALLVIIATSSLYHTRTQPCSDTRDDSDPLLEAEYFFQAAQRILASEHGRIALESIQSRLSSCLFLLNTSRVNQAWFNLGTVVQLCSALGLHRKSRKIGTGDQIVVECRKRTFWSIYTLDVYLSLILGRPALLHDDDISQGEPEWINDEDLTSDGNEDAEPSRDCVTAAAVMHARLARILKTALKDQGRDARHRRNLGGEETPEQQLQHWERSMPVYLSEAIRPSSLIPILARQHSVLRMARAHAVMIIYRPLLLDPNASSTKTTADCENATQQCLKAARLVMNVVRNLDQGRFFPPAFWYFQYITFTALCIIYVFLVQHSTSAAEAEELFASAEDVQTRLSEATRSHAPGLRYGVVLEGLRREVRRRLHEQPTHMETEDGDLIGHSDATQPHGQTDVDEAMLMHELGLTDGFDSSVNLDFWTYLEAMPFKQW